MKCLYRNIVSVGLCLAGVLPVWAGDDPTTTQPAMPPTEALPDAPELIARHIKESGGREAYAAVRNRVARGRIEYVSFNNMTGSLTVYAAEPDQRKLVTEFEGLGRTEETTVTGLGWLVSGIQGPKLYKGRELAYKLRDSTFNPLLKVEQLYSQMHTIAQTELDGQTVYKVALNPVGSSHPETWYFAKDSGLLVQTDKVLERPEGDYPMQIVLKDYKTVDGLLLPHRLEQRQGRIQVNLITDSIEHNVDLPADTFAVPSAVQDLVDGRQTPVPQAPSTPKTGD